MNKKIWKKRLAEALAAALLLGVLPVSVAGMNGNNVIEAHAGGGEEEGTQEDITAAPAEIPETAETPVTDPVIDTVGPEVLPEEQPVVPAEDSAGACRDHHAGYRNGWNRRRRD